MKRKAEQVTATEKPKKRKSRIVRITIVEIIFMSLGVMAILLPLPYRVVALIVIGARGIIVRAIAESRKPPKD